MKFADYSVAVTAAQLDAALRQGGFQGVTHYFGGTPGYVLRVEDPALVRAILSVGWQQAGIFVWRTPADVHGDHDAYVVRNVYGIGSWYRVFLDIEPGAFDADPGGWPPAADAWCDAMRAAGLSPGIYGVDRTCAACGNHADVIWRAVPGMCDPAAAGPQGLNPAFMAGRRAVQCGVEVWNGIEFDVSISQFPFVPTPDPRPVLPPPTGGSMLIVHPTNPKRMDRFAIRASDGHVVAYYSDDQGADGIIAGENPAADYGKPSGTVVAGSVGAVYSDPDGKYITVTCQTDDGRLWLWEGEYGTHVVDHDWTAFGEPAALPVPGPPSTVVPSHTHSVSVSGTASLTGTSGPPA